jgi:hypothetical protein
VVVIASSLICSIKRRFGVHRLKKFLCWEVPR